MNTLKPVFILAALGLASWFVYSTISGGFAPGPEPAHVEGLAAPANEAPLVQMPGSPTLGSPFGGGRSAAAPPPDAWAGSPGGPGAAPVSGSRFDATPPPDSSPAAYPGESIYAVSATNPPLGAGRGGPVDLGIPSGGPNSGAPPYSDAPAYRGEPARNPSPACESGCPIDPPPLRGADRAEADAPAWPSSHSAAGLAPPRDPQAGRQGDDAPPYAGPPDAGAGRTQSHNEADQTFARLMDQVHRELHAGRLAEAHETLSGLYLTPGLSPQHTRQVTELLDRLAGTVIYSRQSLLEPPYVVRPGDTLQSIADRYDVPPALIANINGIRDPRGPQPGQELKVVRGPFHAVIHLADYEMTLMLGRLYAGRFRIGVGPDQPNLEGTYVIADKGVGPTYYGPDGTTFDEHDPRNPLGNLWLGLGERVGQPTRIGIHGTSDPQNVGRNAPRGNIALDQRDIEDVYGILSVGSRVIIQR